MGASPPHTHSHSLGSSIVCEGVRVPEMHSMGTPVPCVTPVYEYELLGLEWQVGSPGRSWAVSPSLHGRHWLGTWG